MTIYRTDIWIAKAIGIILVAYGHFGSMLTKPLWYTLSKDWVYLFHMPLFLMLSGYLFHHTLRCHPSAEIVSRSFKRLIIPYTIFVYPITIITNTWLLGKVITWHTLVSPLYEAQAGAANYLWFLPTLFILHCCAVVLKSSAAKTGLTIAGIFYLLRIACFSPSGALLSLDTPVFFLSYLSYYGIYFFIGLKVADAKSINLNRTELTFLILFFVIVSWVSLYGQLPATLSGVFKLLAGITGSLSVWQFSKHCIIPGGILFDPLVRIGKNSDVIYLSHVFPIYLASLLASRIEFFALCLFSGIALALILSVCIFSQKPRSCESVSVEIDKHYPRVGIFSSDAIFRWISDDG